MIFRKALVRIRREYNTNRNKLFLFSGVATFLAIVIGALLDLLLPFESWSNIIRSIVLIPSAASIFVLGYSVSLLLHYRKTRLDPEWTPYRMRMSPVWRNRVSIIIGAFMFVLIYANGFSVGYTFISSCFVAIGIGLFAFIRPTQAEQSRSKFDIPDSRDVNYDKKFKQLSEKREAEKLKIKEEKMKHRKEKLAGKKEDE